MFRPLCSIHEAQLAQTESLMMFVGLLVDIFLLDVLLLGRVSSRNGEMKRFFCLFSSIYCHIFRKGPLTVESRGKKRVAKFVVIVAKFCRDIQM